MPMRLGRLQRPQVEVGVMSLQDGGLELAQGGDGVVALLPDGVQVRAQGIVLGGQGGICQPRAAPCVGDNASAVTPHHQNPPRGRSTPEMDKN